MLPIIYLDLNQESPSGSAKEDVRAVWRRFLRSVEQDSTNLIVRVLDSQSEPEAIRHLASTCKQWLQHYGILYRLQDDSFGLWLHVENKNNDFGLCASLQNDLCSVLKRDVYLSFFSPTKNGKKPSLATLQDLQETAMAARLMHLTEPILCDRSQKCWALSTFRDAIHNRRLFFVLQPIADLTLMKISGYELLSRIYAKDSLDNQPTLVPTEHWITYVIFSHDSIKLARYALTRGTQWIKQNPQSSAYVAINMTALNFLDEPLIKYIFSLEESIRKRLVLELTEWRNPSIYSDLFLVLQRLRAHGLRIAIDDFGVGYSSTEVLRNFVFDVIKLDTSLMQSNCASDQALINCTLQYAKQHGTQVVAEGIETQELLQRARNIGVHYAQGWHIDALLGQPNVII